MGRKSGSGRRGASASGGGTVPHVVVSFPGPPSAAAVFAVALHATRTTTTAHGPTPAQVDMVLAALDFQSTCHLHRLMSARGSWRADARAAVLRYWTASLALPLAALLEAMWTLSRGRKVL